MHIIAVVVTFNRLPLLQRNMECLRANRGVSHIVVVNNGSTDGTADYLATLPAAHFTIITQANVGGAGGFHRGISEAMQQGAEWIWCMDDDVFPRPDCLEHLLPYTADARYGILAPRRLMNGRIYTNDFTAYNLTNPFASLHKGKLASCPPTEPTEIAGTAFEGPLIRREVVEKIGLPNRELFIFCDDTDYCLRTVRAGYRILSVPAALMDKEHFFSTDSWAERNHKKKWKRFYQVRNATYLNHHYGLNLWVRYLRPLIGVAGYVVTALATCAFSRAYALTDVARFWRAYRDGLAERLGIMQP